MKKDIHPKYDTATIKCACGSTIEVGSTKKDISRGNLFQVPSVFYRQTEAGGHGRPHRAVSQKIRKISEKTTRNMPVSIPNWPTL
jgi:hypothetical protein